MSILKHLYYFTLKHLIQLWFTIEGFIYWVVNALFIEFRRVPPIENKLLLCSAHKLIKMMQNREVIYKFQILNNNYIFIK